MDSGARGSTTTFVENGKGDVLIAWENEAIATLKNHPGKYEIVTPRSAFLHSQVLQLLMIVLDQTKQKNWQKNI